MRKMRHKRLDNLPKFTQLVSGGGRLKHRKSNSRSMTLNFEMELWLVMQKDQTVKCLVTPIQPDCLHGSTTSGVSVATCQQLPCSISRTEGMLNSGQETRVPDTRWIQMGKKLWEKPRKWLQFPFYTNCCKSLLYRRQSTSSLTWPMSLQLHYLIPSLQRLFLYVLSHTCFTIAPWDTPSLSLLGKTPHCEGRHLCPKLHRVEQEFYCWCPDSNSHVSFHQSVSQPWVAIWNEDTKAHF